MVKNKRELTGFADNLFCFFLFPEKRNPAYIAHIGKAPRFDAQNQSFVKECNLVETHQEEL